MLIQVCAQLRAHARARLRLSSAMPWAHQYEHFVPSSVCLRCMYPYEGYACPHPPKMFVWIPSPWLLFRFNSPRVKPISHGKPLSSFLLARRASRAYPGSVLGRASCYPGTVGMDCGTALSSGGGDTSGLPNFVEANEHHSGRYLQTCVRFDPQETLSMGSH